MQSLKTWLNQISLLINTLLLKILISIKYIFALKNYLADYADVCAL